MGTVFRRSGLQVTIVCGLLATVATAAAVSTASGQPAVACGSATTSTLQAVDAMVANNIDRGELSGSETQVDLGHVTGDVALLTALATDSASATAHAVARIVYHHFWHIVRLRVFDAAGRLLADVGGPDVIAPVDGVLRSAAGAQIGTFVMSVQDDVGFTKLETRAVGDPIGIYVGGRLVTELGAQFPKLEPAGASVRLGGLRYSFQTLTYAAFPTGTLDAVIALPPPTAALTDQSCGAVAVAEIGRVAERLALRFHPLAASYDDYVEVVHSETGAEVVVRIGLRVIAGSGGPGPPTLPSSGTVSYEGRLWSVFTFAPTPPATVYLLIPAT
jgi:hypothetical protein